MLYCNGKPVDVAGGMSDAAKSELVECLKKVAWSDINGIQHINDLIDALNRKAGDE